MAWVYLCMDCNAKMSFNRNKGLGTWHCPNGCKRVRKSRNQAGAMSTPNKPLVPIVTGFSYSPCKRVWVT